MGQALANAALASVAGGHFVEAESFNQQSLEAIGKLDSSHDQASLYATVGQSYRTLALKRPSQKEGLLSQADHAFQLAQASAEKIGDHLLLADALGNLASLEMLRNHTDEALPLTRRAVFHARQANSPDALYRWEWQSARLLQVKGETDAAISAYRRAVESFQDIRQDIALGHGNHLTGVLLDHGEESFEERAGALFFELADLVLRKADSLAGNGQEQAWLEEALRTIESLRSAELDDYLQDQCVRLQRSRAAGRVLPGAAVLHDSVHQPDRVAN